MEKELLDSFGQLFFICMKRVAFHTLGCKLNFAETSTLGRQFLHQGYQVVQMDQPAEVCVINTCSVTERADRECRQIVRRALRHSPDAFVIVVGCYAQLQPETVASITGVDLVLGSKEKFDLFTYADGFRKTLRARIAVTPIGQVDTFGAASSIGLTDRTRAFLKVQDGCDYSCAFCTIPLARGASRSITVEEAMTQAKEIVAQGYRELVLTGVNVGDYGKKIGTNLLSLLNEMVKIPDLRRIRVSSVEPNLLQDDLLDFWLTSDVVCNHFHVPLQGGSDELLRSMRRRYLRDWYSNRIEKIKSSCPEACIGADVIVGFPGETDELFEETYRYLLDLPLSYLHVFTYSERPNTAAMVFQDRVEPRIRFERSERLRILSVKKRRAFYETFVGSDVEVLFEEKKETAVQTGLTSEYVRVNVRTNQDLVNQIHKVKVISVEENGCRGHLALAPQLNDYQASEGVAALCA